MQFVDSFSNKGVTKEVATAVRIFFDEIVFLKNTVITLTEFYFIYILLF